MSEVALLRIEGGKANAMTAELLDTIEQHIDDFERGPARAAVITGYDKYFSAGLALPALIDLDRPAMGAFIERFARAMLRVFRCEKPIVAAINGHAIAGGCVLALMCDYRVIVNDDGVRIGLNETQLGIGLPAVVLEPLRAQVPATSLTSLAINGALVTPQQALALGLVHEVGGSAHAIAARLAAVPPVAAAQVKRALRRPVLEAIAQYPGDTDAWLDTWFSPHAQERLRAAVAKMTR
ncbi:MAG: enoyl-CoA hydratase/isomerase family protein [Myxococcota bacterium]|nr:enoyl-CoA hydratase/isomerase family protein [Deltaproteobacteria bacterium]MDQ3337206.1 enoyl-CoA hydratase/isomerase family protein [Myxococcota bacterium]